MRERESFFFFMSGGRLDVHALHLAYILHLKQAFYDAKKSSLTSGHSPFQRRVEVVELISQSASLTQVG